MLAFGNAPDGLESIRAQGTGEGGGQPPTNPPVSPPASSEAPPEPVGAVEIQTPPEPQPEEPIIAPEPLPTFQPPQKRRSRRGLIIGIVLAVIVIGLIAGVGLGFIKVFTTTTTLSTTTVPKQNFTTIKGCINVNKPGLYYLTNNVSTSIRSGACINVTSSNVRLIGNGNGLIGSGPYVAVPPFTYGIRLNNVKNVSVSGIIINYFSYGVYLYNASNSSVTNTTALKETMAAVYLNSSSKNLIANSSLGGTSSSQGAVSLVGGRGNRIMSDTVKGNAYYGIVVNSTNNTFSGDKLVNNLVDFACDLNSSLRTANRFGSTACAVNQNCNFAQCSQTNTPSNLSAIRLSGRNINGCGTVYQSGIYTLSNSIDVLKYLNMSNPLSKNEACINIRAPNVKLNCNGNSINNAGYAVSAVNLFNITINNCNIVNASYGVYLKSDFYAQVLNGTISRSTYGIYLKNTSTAFLTNTLTTNNTYGIYVETGNALTLSGFNTTKNVYGAYINSTVGSSISGGSLLSNSKSDLYCSTSSYNSSRIVFKGSACGSSDCAWAASCTTHTLPALPVFKIGSCYNVTIPGSYMLNTSLYGSNRCINIATSNVSFNCNFFSIIGNLTTGNAIYISKQKNVQVSNCNIQRFKTGILVQNSSYVTLNNNNGTSLGIGISMSNSSFSTVTNNRVLRATMGNGFVFSNVLRSVISYNTGMAGINGSSGFTFNRSSSDIVSFNNATSNIRNGFNFLNSNSNNVFNNTAALNSNYDYSCSLLSSGLYAENGGGVNAGNTKNNCIWLVEQNPYAVPVCPSIGVGSTVLLTNDFDYPYGHTCISVYRTNVTSGNYSLINCNYHTIYAGSGGIFARVINATGVIVQNCYLKNFTNAISDSGQYFSALNNTIGGSNASILVLNTKGPTIRNNNIMNSRYGVFAQSSSLGTIMNNNITNTSIGMEFTGGGQYLILNNTARNGMIGGYIINSTMNQFQNNRMVNMSTFGFACTLSASNTTSQNIDKGGNYCAGSNSKCRWLSC